MYNMQQLARTAAQEGASDIFIKVGVPPMVKVSGTVHPVGDEPLTPEDTEELCLSLMTREKDRRKYDQTLSCNLAWQSESAGRFRVNVYTQRGTMAMVLRKVSTQVPTLDGLGMPETLKSVCMERTGLVLVTGATGSGKSTTLAAMVDHRCRNHAGHIVTIEDPIEFLQPDHLSIVSQREVGTDCDSFADALKDALREAPDVVLVGEIRDREVMEVALHFAETGHLVMGTLHSTNASQTLDRVINFFPKEEEVQTLLALSLNLRAVVSQRLIPRADGQGRIVAQEILVCTPRVKDLVKRNEVNSLKPTMESGTQEGMQTFDQALYALVNQGMVEQDVALTYAESPGDLKLKLRGFV
jgi:twitching motility protein PilU